jgi:hypothetical protein
MDGSRQQAGGHQPAPPPPALDRTCPTGSPRRVTLLPRPCDCSSAVQPSSSRCRGQHTWRLVHAALLLLLLLAGTPHGERGVSSSRHLSIRCVPLPLPGTPSLPSLNASSRVQGPCTLALCTACLPALAPHIHTQARWRSCSTAGSPTTATPRRSSVTLSLAYAGELAQQYCCVMTCCEPWGGARAMPMPDQLA